MDIWSWICELPNSEEWNSSNSKLTFPIAVSSSNKNNSSINLRAEQTLDSNSEVSITLSIFYQGFQSSIEETTIWISNSCPLSSNTPFLPLVLQLLQEIVSCAPTTHDNQLHNLKPDPVSWILHSHSPESFSNFFNVILLTRLFWLSVSEAPSEVGSFYFRSLLAPNLSSFSCKKAPVLKNFFVTVGADVEICFVRTFGYMLAKWLILREMEVGLKSLAPLPVTNNLGFSYAMESHGLWILKGFSPVSSMQCLQSYGPSKKSSSPFPGLIDAKESLLKYALAHQQLEAVIQIEYTVEFHDNFIQVNARLDNIRIHVVKLGFQNNSSNEEIVMDERHFPSRIRIWFGPEVGASYVGGLSLGRSTDNTEKEMEMQKIVKGSSGKLKTPKVKAMAKMATRTKIKNWRWDQDVEGNAAIYDAMLCDNNTGVELATCKGPIGEKIGNNFRSRYTGSGRAFTKSGGLIFSGAEYDGDVRWRLSREMEGSVLKWRIGVGIWLSYLPNDMITTFCETRCVEWCDEVDLPLIRSN